MIELLVFALASGIALVAAGFVLLHRNPVVCALALVVNLLCVAILFVSLGAQFVAALQIIVYAGAIMVLIVFVIMLLALPKESKVLQASGGPAAVTAVLAAGAVLAALIVGIQSIQAPLAVAGEDFGTAAWVAHALFTTWFYPFELVSLVLIAAMAGAILLAKREL